MSPRIQRRRRRICRPSAASMAIADLLDGVVVVVRESVVQRCNAWMYRIVISRMSAFSSLAGRPLLQLLLMWSMLLLLLILLLAATSRAVSLSSISLSCSNESLMRARRRFSISGLRIFFGSSMTTRIGCKWSIEELEARCFSVRWSCCTFASWLMNDVWICGHALWTLERWCGAGIVGRLHNITSAAFSLVVLVWSSYAMQRTCSRARIVFAVLHKHTHMCTTHRQIVCVIHCLILARDMRLRSHNNALLLLLSKVALLFLRINVCGYVCVKKDVASRMCENGYDGERLCVRKVW